MIKELYSLRGKLATVLAPIAQKTLGVGVPSKAHLRMMSSPEVTWSSTFGPVAYGGT